MTEPSSVCPFGLTHSSTQSIQRRQMTGVVSFCWFPVLPKGSRTPRRTQPPKTLNTPEESTYYNQIHVSPEDPDINTPARGMLRTAVGCLLAKLTMHQRWPSSFSINQLIINYQLGHLADAFIQSDLHRLIHTLTHRRQSPPCKATASSSGAVRVKCLAQGHINTSLARRSWGSN
jgi:hypothetical protein